MNSIISHLSKRGDITIQTFDTGDTAYLLISTCMVLIMVPGLGFLYSGLARRKSALSLIWACWMGGIVAIFQWYFWGYSLAFSKTASNHFIGDLSSFGLKNLLEPAAKEGNYPELVFAAYQGMFMAVTAAIIVGAICERGRLFPSLVFTFIWCTIVYCPIAYWVWNSNGWAYRYGVLDYAGGGPVEIGSGFAAFAYSAALGPRKEKFLANFRAHNVSMVTLGTALLWFGWLGFNGGSALGANMRAAYSIWNSNLTAALGAVTWVLLDWRMARKFTAVGMCSGVICGLVAATPASGCITLYGSVVLGIVASTVCNFSTKIKYLVHVDDSLDCFAEHGMAGVVGLIFNALFGADWVIGLDGATDHDGGWISHNWKQLYKQIAYTVACCAYVLVITYVICIVLNKIPGCHLRATEDGEFNGMDEDQVGEFAYDYVEVRRDWLAWGSDDYTKQQTPVNIEVHDGIDVSTSDVDNQVSSNQDLQEKV